MKLDELKTKLSDIGLQSIEQKTDKFILTIVCDTNDADYVTEITELDIYDEYFNIDLFLGCMKTLQKLITPDTWKGEYYGKRYMYERWNLLSIEDKTPLFEMDRYKQDEEWINRCFTDTLEKYSIKDGSGDGHDSVVKQWFPCVSNDYDLDNRVNGCHTLKSIDLVFIDENGQSLKII